MQNSEETAADQNIELNSSSSLSVRADDVYPEIDNNETEISAYSEVDISNDEIQETYCEINDESVYSANGNEYIDVPLPNAFHG